MQLPEQVKFIISELNKNGYEGYIVGGCVRDYLMAIPPHDYDITTSALPEEVKAIFPHTVDTGIEHGTVTVIIDKIGYELTTYRIDGEYKDNRHPEQVIFTDKLAGDLSLCEAGLAACRALADAGVRVNMTLVFSPTQALMAANAGARYISPFVGRFDDIAEDGISQLDNVVTCIKNYDWTGKNVDDTVEIITASVRTPNHVTQAALLGADIATVPMAALKKCLHHPLTDQGLASFEADWQKVVAQA